VIFVTDKPTDWRALCAELTDEELYQFWESHPELGLTCDEPVKLLRAGLTHFARPTIKPVPVAERPWERECGWLDLDGECWWCPPEGPPYWQMANPAMVYGGWLLPARAMPVPQP
jgi:hypothetical protein